eukprot:CAMPEP_0177713642 /NCGR_PEP_ID=MMETSP0484_2-20121128/13048_1 /TAXON_ID=354590 /ORGANISM="Rhodomonas lens, Strain RHODO" /LENGTH=248 /DNA_ID=CAMNT_0019225545 /DNA_START=47 /DNA_END=789 /DNA_ORIENTATION=-
MALVGAARLFKSVAKEIEQLQTLFSPPPSQGGGAPFPSPSPHGLAPSSPLPSSSKLPPSAATSITKLDGRGEVEEEDVFVLGEGGKTVKVEPEGTMFDPDTLTPVHGFKPDLSLQALDFTSDPWRYLQQLHTRVNFVVDIHAKSTCGLLLSGTYVTFVVPNGPADFTAPDGARVDPKDQILSVDGSDVTAETVGLLLRGDDAPGTPVHIRVRKATWFGEVLEESVTLARAALSPPLSLSLSLPPSLSL